MAKSEKTKKKITKKLLHKYRLVILNEETFEERMTFKLSRLNVFVAVGFSTIFLVVLTTFIIAITPLREYIPGYSSTVLKKETVNLLYKTDSLERVIESNGKYYASIQKILMGESVDDERESDSVIQEEQLNAEDVRLSPSEEDSILRREVEKNDKYNVLNPAEDRIDFKFFLPLKGKVTDDFDVEKQHYGIDVSVAENQPVKATADGTIIFAEWTVETGYVIIIEHDYGVLSVYKHNSTLNKKQGDMVKTGEVIAMSGNTGEWTTGPHLHFEIWNNGHPVDPAEFLDFE